MTLPVIAENGDGGKARYFCAAEGCDADTLKKWRYRYMKVIEIFTKEKSQSRACINLFWQKDYDPLRHHRVQYICKIPKLHILTLVFYF